MGKVNHTAQHFQPQKKIPPKRKVSPQKQTEEAWELLFYGIDNVTEILIFFIIELSPPPNIYSTKIKSPHAKRVYELIWSLRKKKRGEKNPLIGIEGDRVHHMVPKTRAGKLNFNSDNRENKVWLSREAHSALHKLFGNRTPEEIIIYLMKLWNQKPFLEEKDVLKLTKTLSRESGQSIN